MTEPKPSQLYQPVCDKPRTWELEERRESGVFVMSRSGALLFRVELNIGMMYFWDKKAGVEVPISITELPFNLWLTIGKTGVDYR